MLLLVAPTGRYDVFPSHIRAQLIVCVFLSVSFFDVGLFRCERICLSFQGLFTFLLRVFVRQALTDTQSLSDPLLSEVTVLRAQLSIVGDCVCSELDECKAC